MHAAQPVRILADALTFAGLATFTYPNYQAMKWSKLLLNIINNASSAILDEAPSQIISHPQLLDMEIEAIAEGVQVMKAMNLSPVNLPGYPVDWLARLVSTGWLPAAAKRVLLRPSMQGGRGAKMPSLHIDLAAGRTTSEVEALNGAIARAGQALGIATPVNETLTEILTGLVAGKLERVDYRRQPQKLLQAIAVRRKQTP
jgi:2-dehydropantoate 2-reductase